MFQTFKQFHTQEETLHKNFRTQVLNSITAIHRQAVAGLIGQLAISANPDKSVTARQIDVLLSASERNAILSAHSTYETQSRTLHQQAMQQMEKYLPAGAPQPGTHHMNPNGKTRTQVTDAGEILLRVLTSDDGRGMHGGMFPMGPPMGHPQ
jgi:hypothetical protein